MKRAIRRNFRRAVDEIVHLPRISGVVVIFNEVHVREVDAARPQVPRLKFGIPAPQKSHIPPSAIIITIGPHATPRLT